MKLKGKITISRISSTCGDDYMRISLIDDDAGIEFCTAKMSLENFANCITGRGYIECGLDLHGIDKVGMKAENKVENVKRMRGQSAKDAVKSYEVDGWVGRTKDAENHHNVCEHNYEKGYNIYRVVFHRWVEKDECNHENSRVDT